MKTNEVSYARDGALLIHGKPKVFPSNIVHPPFCRWGEREAKTEPPANCQTQVSSIHLGEGLQSFRTTARNFIPKSSALNWDLWWCGVSHSSFIPYTHSPPTPLWGDRIVCALFRSGGILWNGMEKPVFICIYLLMYLLNSLSLFLSLSYPNLSDWFMFLVVLWIKWIFFHPLWGVKMAAEGLSPCLSFLPLHRRKFLMISVRRSRKKRTCLRFSASLWSQDISIKRLCGEAYTKSQTMWLPQPCVF